MMVHILRIQWKEIILRQVRILFQYLNTGVISALTHFTVSQSAALPADLYDVPATLVNPNTTDNAKRLMSYMTDIYGKKFLSGQYCDNAYGIERSGIWRVTGKYPAVLGLDMTGYSTSSVENGATTQAVENAIDYWNDGGIVTFCMALDSSFKVSDRNMVFWIQS